MTLYDPPGLEGGCAILFVLAARISDAFAELLTNEHAVTMDECVLRTHQAIVMHGDHKARLPRGEEG
jgi:hypothetical protein